MTTSRVGGLHKPPWGISHAEPIGSSNDPPLAEVAPLPQMWQLSFSLLLCKGRWIAKRDGGIVCSLILTVLQSLTRHRRELPLHKGAFRCGGNCAKLKLFGTTSSAGGFRFTIQKSRGYDRLVAAYFYF